MTDEEVRQLAADSDTGGRKPTGLSAKIVMYTALAWSTFQLWIASPLPFSLGKYFTNTSKLGFIIYGALVLAAVIVVLIVRAVVKKKKKKAPVKQA